MAKYRVRPGYNYGPGHKYKAGDIVELTEQEAAGDLNRLKLVSGKVPSDAVGSVTIETIQTVPADKAKEGETGKADMAEEGETARPASTPKPHADTDKTSVKKA